MVGLAPPILKGPTSFVMDLVAHDSSQEVGNFGDRLRGASMVLVISNGRIESMNTKIRLITPMACGFTSPDTRIALVMLSLGDRLGGHELVLRGRN